MRILFLSTRSPYPLISGHSLRTYHMVKGAAQRHRVTLVTFIQLEVEGKEENVEHLRGFCEDVFQFKIPMDMSRMNLAASVLRNLLSPAPLVAQKYNVDAMRKRIRETIGRNRFDLVHVDLLPLSVYTNEFKGLPKLLTNHNVESLRLKRWFQTESNPARKFYLGIQWLKLRRFELSALNSFDCCVVVSEQDKRILEEMGARKGLFVVPNGTDTSFFSPSSEPAKEKSILWLGHMDVHTNRDAVLHFWNEIFPLLRRREPSMEMTFVGTSPPQEIADAARGDSLVKVTGFVDDIRPYVRQAAVVVVPIRIGSGTRIKILDAMAMGKAVVSTSVGCEGLNTTNRRDIMIADDPCSFADSVIELLNNEGIRKQMEKEARQFAEAYDWRRMVEKQEAIYRHLVADTQCQKE